LRSHYRHPHLHLLYGGLRGLPNTAPNRPTNKSTRAPSGLTPMMANCGGQVTRPGRWVGYYVEVKFPSDTGLIEDFVFTTPGYAWPNSLPYADCTGVACKGHPL
jgi:hypothetical protein